MIRKLLLPALFVGLLGGCATGYGYRDGYYYGQPSVEYRYYDYGYPYYPGYYGHYPYSGHSYYYGYPYYSRRPYYYYNPYYYHRPKPPRPGTPSTDDGDNDNPPPWRDPNLRGRRDDDAVERALRSRVQAPRHERDDAAPRSELPRQSRSEGSRVRQALQRSQESRRRSSDTQER